MTPEEEPSSSTTASVHSYGNSTIEPQEQGAGDEECLSGPTKAAPVTAQSRPGATTSSHPQTGSASVVVDQHQAAAVACIPDSDSDSLCKLLPTAQDGGVAISQYDRAQPAGYVMSDYMSNQVIDYMSLMHGCPAHISAAFTNFM